MEQSNRQIISDVIGELKSLNIDDRISQRHVLSRLKDKARYFIKQDLDSRRLFKITNIWKRIRCFDMEKVDIMECGFDIPHCNCIMKSCKKLPKSYDSSYGTLVRVFILDGNKEYKQIKFGDYTDIKNREYQDKSIKYFWIDNDYIYIPDSEVAAVTVMGLFERPEEVDKINNEKGAECAKPLDQFFPCPEHLLDVIKKETILEFARIYKGIVEDQRPDQNSNVKS